MKIAVFTSNQARHVALVHRLAAIAGEVFAVQECNTLFPGEVPDFVAKSDVMQRYFRRVLDAEEEVFGRPGFLPGNVRSFAMKMGDLSRVGLDGLEPALGADVAVVFGASYVKGPLCERLVALRALNLHLGVSPYYRGSACNFWALHDGRPDLVGATVHLLTAGLDSGPMLFHALPRAGVHDPFVLGMRAVDAGQRALVDAIASGRIAGMEPVRQDRSLCLRYARGAEFTDDVAGAYLQRLPLPDGIESALGRRDPSLFLRPVEV
jgi:hypothetical protein